MKLADSQYDVFNIQIADIWVDDTFNCRDTITVESVEELSQSIADDDLLFPVVCQPAEEVSDIPAGFKYRLVCGYRRVLAVKLLRWDTIPANIRVGLTERQALLMNFQENLERKELNILEEAKMLERLFSVHRTIKSISVEIKKPEKWVGTRKHLLLLPEFIQKAAASGRLNTRDITRLSRSDNPEELARAILRAAKDKRKTRFIKNGRVHRTKSEVRGLIAALLRDGFNPQLLRLLSWSIGDTTDEQLNETLLWLREKKGWLK